MTTKHQPSTTDSAPVRKAAKSKPAFAGSAKFAALLAAATLGLTACSAGASTAPSASVTPAADSVTIEDAWVKAADSGMSAAFGTLVNDGGADATVVSVTSEASSSLQLHETVENDAGEMEMREVDGGFVIPAHGSFELAPGANHIMLMDLTAPLTAGDVASFTLHFSDDSTLDFDAQVKDYAGANENYSDDSGSDSGHSGHEHSDSEHSDSGDADSEHSESEH